MPPEVGISGTSWMVSPLWIVTMIEVGPQAWNAVVQSSSGLGRRMRAATIGGGLSFAVAATSTA